MDVGLPGGPVKSAPAGSVGLTLAESAADTKGAVRTELPAGSAVAQVAETPALRLDITDTGRRMLAASEALRRTIERHIDIEPPGNEIVVKVVDRLSRQVVSQVPREDILRLRATLRALLAEQQDNAPHIDRNA